MEVEPKLRTRMRPVCACRDNRTLAGSLFPAMPNRDRRHKLTGLVQYEAQTDDELIINVREGHCPAHGSRVQIRVMSERARAPRKPQHQALRGCKVAPPPPNPKTNPNPNHNPNPNPTPIGVPRDGPL